MPMPSRSPWIRPRTSYEGVAGQQGVSRTHRFQQAEPHTLTVEYGLVAMYADTDGVLLRSTSGSYRSDETPVAGFR